MNFRHIILVGFLALAFSFSLTGCSSDSSSGGGGGGQISIADYFPMAVGYSWSYKECYEDGTIKDYEEMTFLDKVTLSPGTDVYLTHEAPDYEGFALKDDGFYALTEHILDEAHLLKVSDSNPQEGDIQNYPNGGYCKILSTSTSKTIGLGTYSCIKIEYRYEAGAEWFRVYLAENIGAIFYEFYDEANQFKDYRELTDYDFSPNPPPGEVDIRDYFPLAVGYQWVYEHHYMSEPAVIQSTEIMGTYTFTPSGVMVYLADDDPNEAFGFAYKNDGMYVILYQPLAESNLWKVCNTYPEAGEILYRPDGGISQIISTDTQKTIGLGTFQCIKLKGSAPIPSEGWAYTWLGEGVGIIYQEFYRNDGTYTGYNELISHNVPQ